jgi:hypothetical protein
MPKSIWPSFPHSARTTKHLNKQWVSRLTALNLVNFTPESEHWLKAKTKAYQSISQHPTEAPRHLLLVFQHGEDLPVSRDGKHSKLNLKADFTDQITVYIVDMVGSTNPIVTPTSMAILLDSTATKSVGTARKLVMHWKTIVNSNGEANKSETKTETPSTALDVLLSESTSPTLWQILPQRSRHLTKNRTSTDELSIPPATHTSLHSSLSFTIIVHLKFPQPFSVVRVSGKSVLALGKGSVTLTDKKGQKYTITDVMYVADSKSSILSMMQLWKQ